MHNQKGSETPRQEVSAASLEAMSARVAHSVGTIFHRKKSQDWLRQRAVKDVDLYWALRVMEAHYQLHSLMAQNGLGSGPAATQTLTNSLAGSKLLTELEVSLELLEAIRAETK